MLKNERLSGAGRHSHRLMRLLHGTEIMQIAEHHAQRADEQDQKSVRADQGRRKERARRQQLVCDSDRPERDKPVVRADPRFIPSLIPCYLGI
jgi:hypothetical protein